jgi:YHS domain-containing protein
LWGDNFVSFLRLLCSTGNRPHKKEKSMQRMAKYVFFVAMMLVPVIAHASDRVSTVAVQGYDLVSYHQGDGIPTRGNGNHVVHHNGASYLFATSANKMAFMANPEKYLPAFGGYCAYGVTKHKKFISDPMAYTLVNGKLYLNLNKDVQRIWSQDIAGHIAAARKIWPEIKEKAPGDL